MSETERHPLHIEADDLAALSRARYRGTSSFYFKLRLAHQSAYLEGTTFPLPANDLARREFVAGRRDRKYYLRATGELLTLGLLIHVKRAGYDATQRRRAPALFKFGRRRSTVDDGTSRGNIHVLLPRRSTSPFHTTDTGLNA